MVQQPLCVDAVILAQDAAETIAATIARVPRPLVRSVVVVDSGSLDNTAQAAKDSGAVVVRCARGGDGSALQAAIAHLESLPEPPSVVAFLSPFGDHEAAALGELIEPFVTQHAELVLAASPRGESKPRDEIVAGRLISTLYGHRFRTFSGFRAIAFPALVALGLRAKGSAWAVEMQVKALRFGLQIVEVVVQQGNSEQRRRSIARRAKDGGRVLYQIFRYSTAR